MENKDQAFNVIEEGTKYELFNWTVIDNKGIGVISSSQELSFVRGDKRAYTAEQYENACGLMDSLAGYFGYVKSDGTKPFGVNAVHLTPEGRQKYMNDYKAAAKIVEIYRNPILRVDGIVHEQLIGVLIDSLEYKNTLVPSAETTKALNKFKEGLFWLQERQKDRTKRNVQGTYNK